MTERNVKEQLNQTQQEGELAKGEPSERKAMRQNIDRQ
jgi:hypothetical protein